MQSNDQHAYPAPLPAPAADNLRRLVILRYIVIGGLSLAWLAVNLGFAWHVPATPVIAALALLAAVNLATRLRLSRPWPVTEAELFIQLLVDVGALSALLYYTGGSANPLVSLYLLPLMLAATLLPRSLTWAMAAVTVTCYTLLMFYNEPLAHAQHEASFSLHLLGMWFTFVLSAGLISHFAVAMARGLRERDRLLSAAREEALRNERIVALGTVAAGAAHELGSPLATMALLAEELAALTQGEARESATELGEQVMRCRGILNDLLASAGHTRAESAEAQPADRFFDDVLAKWQLVRPAVPVDCRWTSARPAAGMVVDQTLMQALLNLLNNAADASPQGVEIEGGCAGGELAIEIRDRGAGLAPEALARLGQPFFTTKAGKGFGLGLFLANATVERFGGSVQLYNRDDGPGACTRVRLPLLNPEAAK